MQPPPERQPPIMAGLLIRLAAGGISFLLFGFFWLMILSMAIPTGFATLAVLYLLPAWLGLTVGTVAFSSFLFDWLLQHRNPM